MIFRKNNDKNDYWDILKVAEKELISWDSSKAINIYRIEYVAVFEEWSEVIELYIFYKTENEKLTVLNEGYFDKIKDYYIKLLKKHNYPFVLYPKIDFIFDSDESVKQNYNGSYFFRLR